MDPMLTRQYRRPLPAAYRHPKHSMELVRDITGNSTRHRAASGASIMNRSRVCMPTWRDFNKGAFQCGLYEAQDIIAETDAVDVITLKAKPGLRSREQWQKNLVYHDPSGTLMYMNPGLKRVRLVGEYQLFIVVCQNLRELLYVNAIDGWREQCRKSICWIDEMWASAVPRYKRWLRALEQFDHICVGYRGTVDPLSKALGRQCHWIPEESMRCVSVPSLVLLSA